MKFKVGDTVRVLNDDMAAYGIRKGDLGEVYRLNRSESFPIKVKIRHKTGEWSFKMDEIEYIHSLESAPEKAGPKKYDDNKPMMHLVRPEFIKGLSEALTYGATKYDEKRGSEPNYMRGEGFQYSKVLDSLERHLNAFKSGEAIDPESQQHHLLLAGVNTMFLYMYEISDKGKDDRYILPAKKDIDE